MTIDSEQVTDSVLESARRLVEGRGAEPGTVAVAMLHVSIWTFYKQALRDRKEAGDLPLVPIGIDQVRKIVYEAAEFIGERLDAAETDQAERN